MSKTTFININLGNKVSLLFLFIHSGFSIIWTIGISIFFFRLDLLLFESFPEKIKWFASVLPLLFLFIVVLIISRIKWYYVLVLLFYPFLLFFWFFPKIILKNGKIYLLSEYIDLLYTRVKALRKTVIHLLIISLSILVLLISEIPSLRIFTMVYFSILFLSILIDYIKNAFQPIRLFGANFEEFLDSILKNPSRAQSVIGVLEHGKPGQKRQDKRNWNNQITERLVLFNFIIKHIASQVSGFKGRKAFTISWIFHFVFILSTSILFFTFINFQFYVLDEANFNIDYSPNLFDFLYYTIKTFTFSSLADFYPQSIWSKSVEIISYLIVGIIIIIFPVSIFFPLRQKKIDQGVGKFLQVCNTQSSFIEHRLKYTYSRDAKVLMSETSNVFKSLEKIRKIIEQLL